MIVKEKHFCYILLTDQISLSDFFYFLRYDKLSIEIVCYPVCDVTNFENCMYY